MLSLYTLADRLHKTVGEIVAMPVEEFMGWMAYCNLLHEKGS